MKWTRALAIGGSLGPLIVAAGCNDSPCCGPGPSSLTVMAVSPATGSVAGGTSVTITGTNFINVTSVTIGGTELGNRTVVSSTQITGTTPAGTSPGATDVVVTSSSQGSSTCSGCFGYESANAIAAALAAGGSLTCALTSSGAAYCWGDGRTTPVAVAEGWTFSAIAIGGHFCALTTSGAAYCWGYNAYGQLGDGTTTNSNTPVAVVGGHSFVALAVGAVHTCGLTSVGTAYCWGDNGDGPLGDGSTTSSATPVAVVGGHHFI